MVGPYKIFVGHDRLGWGLVRRSVEQDALAEQGEACAVVGLSFEEFDLVVDAFGGPLP